MLFSLSLLHSKLPRYENTYYLKSSVILFACCYVHAFVDKVKFPLLRFQNEYNKVENALRVVQFWSEIKLVFANRAIYIHAFDVRPNCISLSITYMYILTVS